MSEWWTYRPEDLLLFSTRTYWRLFELANAALWPLQIPIFCLGALTLIWICHPRPWSDRVISGLMALAWTATGFWFVGSLFVKINWAAIYAVPAFAAEAVLFVWFGAIRQELRFAVGRNLSAIMGLGLVAYALALHPVVAPLAGRPIAAAEIIGIAPDPTAIATMGLLVLHRRRPAGWLMLVPPALWCIASSATLLTMAAWEGWLPLAATFLAAVAQFLTRRPKPTAD